MLPLMPPLGADVKGGDKGCDEGSSTHLRMSELDAAVPFGYVPNR
jgi:hypothetical protein